MSCIEASCIKPAKARGLCNRHYRLWNNSNRGENLELRVGAHPQGLSISDALSWAEEIMNRYSSMEVFA